MIVITSPAKTQDFDSSWDSIVSQPRYLETTARVHKKLLGFSKKKLKEVLSVSDKLRVINSERLELWDIEHNEKNSKPAILAYRGDIYRQFDATTFTKDQQEYLQDRLRIITGYYGALRPYDLIQPYRLEMKAKLKVGRPDNLYQLWSEMLTADIEHELSSFYSDERFLLDISSSEYGKVIDQKVLSYPVVTVEFRQIKDGVEKNIGLLSKAARGLFIKYLADSRPASIDALKNFDYGGYRFVKEVDGSMYFVKTVNR